MNLVSSQDVLTFWFETCTPQQWFMKDLAFDEVVRDKFHATHSAATCGELEHWRQTPDGRLAEVIVLDQFSRNMFRDSPQAFAYDPLALALAQEAVRQGDDMKLDIEHRSFMYMPYMHSESKKVHLAAVELFSQPGAEYNYEFELKHKAIIDQFGRYPHRNAILGRESSKEELGFLQQPNSSF